MVDFKKLIGDELSAIPGVAKVQDVYPESFNAFPIITFYEQGAPDNLPAIPGARDELIFQVDVWHNRSTTEISNAINARMNAIGFVRQFRADIPDPSGIKRKTMRFRAVYDSRANRVHQ